MKFSKNDRIQAIASVIDCYENDLSNVYNTPSKVTKIVYNNVIKGNKATNNKGFKMNKYIASFFMFIVMSLIFSMFTMFEHSSKAATLDVAHVILGTK
jgi:hypothetical protein